MNVLVDELCPTLCHPMDCSLPGSSVHGILQARILEWVAILFSRGSSQPESPALQTDSLPPEPPGENTVIFLKCYLDLTHGNYIVIFYEFINI